jgi:predicted XRE-type DNA-binding protein
LNTKTKETKPPHITRGNVFEDIGFSRSEALELRVKAEVYADLLSYIRQSGMTQRELSTALGIHQPDVSTLLSGRVSKFSVGKLIQFAGKLNLVAEVKLTRPKLPRKPEGTVKNVRANRSQRASVVV